MIKSRLFTTLVIPAQDLFQFSWFVIKTYSSFPKIFRSSSEAADPSTDSQSCAHCPSYDKLDCMGSGNLTKYWALCVSDMFLFHLEMEGEIAFVTKGDFSSFKLNALQLLQWDNSLIFHMIIIIKITIMKRQCNEWDHDFRVHHHVEQHEHQQDDCRPPGHGCRARVSSRCRWWPPPCPPAGRRSPQSPERPLWRLFLLPTLVIFQRPKKVATLRELFTWSSMLLSVQRTSPEEEYFRTKPRLLAINPVTYL